jgi:hypothetical protein
MGSESHQFTRQVSPTHYFVRPDSWRCCLRTRTAVPPFVAARFALASASQRSQRAVTRCWQPSPSSGQLDHPCTLMDDRLLPSVAAGLCLAISNGRDVEVPGNARRSRQFRCRPGGLRVSFAIRVMSSRPARPRCFSAVSLYAQPTPPGGEISPYRPSSSR